MKTLTFLNENKRNSMALFLRNKSWYIHTYRYVAGGSFIYCIDYWI